MVVAAGDARVGRAHFVRAAEMTVAPIGAAAWPADLRSAEDAARLDELVAE